MSAFFGRSCEQRIGRDSSRAYGRQGCPKHDVIVLSKEGSMPRSGHWVGTWAAAPAPAEGVVGFNNHTLRMNPRIRLGGDRLRVRISNAYGNRPMTIGAAQIALRDEGPAIVAGSGRKLSFGGSESGVIAAGAVLF